MKKFTLVSIVAAAIVLAGCGDEAKKVATETATKATEKTQEVKKDVVDTATKAVKTTKEIANETVENTKATTDDVVVAVKKAGNSISEATDSAVAATKEAATNAMDKAKESVTEVVERVTPNNEAGVAAFAKCAGCHGADGKTKALNKSEIIAGQPKEDIVTKLNAYKAGTRNISGMGTVMKGQVAAMSDADIDAVAQYISTLK